MLCDALSNRIAKVEGNCETSTVSESWSYQYDGDGIRVGEWHFVGLNENPDWTKSYYFGGVYETHSDGTVSKYYSFVIR